MPGLTPQKFAPERSQGLPTERIPSAAGEPRSPLLALLRCASWPRFGTEGVPLGGCSASGPCQELLPAPRGALGGCRGPAPAPTPG